MGQPRYGTSVDAISQGSHDMVSVDEGEKGQAAGSTQGALGDSKSKYE